MDILDNFPDGVIVGKYLIFSGSKRVYIARGFIIDPLALEGLSDDFLELYRHKLESFLTLVTRDEYDIQIQRSFDSDYSSELLSYKQKDTGRYPFSSYVRDCVFNAYNMATQKGALRREYMQLYIGKWFSDTDTLSTRKKLLDFLEGLNSIFSNFARQISNSLDGATVKSMEQGDYYESYFKIFNPSFSNRFREMVGQDRYIPNATIMDNVYSGECVEHGDGNTGMVIDGKYYGFVTLGRWPSQSVPNITRPLTRLPFNEARIVFNVHAVNLPQEIEKLESQEQKLKNRGERLTRRERQSLEALQVRATELHSGAFQPVDVVGMVIYWADSQEDLRVRADIIKTAIRSMSGADYINENNAIGARRILALSMPGWVGQMAHRRLDLDTLTLADLLPISNATTGFLKDGQVILDNDNGGLFGLSLFSGNTPLHTFVTGASRAGKSVGCIDIMSQIVNELGYLVIVESGNSWGTFVKAMGGQSIIVKSDGSMTFNYLDTAGVPLSPSHLEFCVSICLAMTKTADPDLLRKRKGLIEKAIKGLYKDRFSNWRGDYPDRYEIMRRVFAAIKKYGLEHQEEFESFGELVSLWKDMAASAPAMKDQLIKNITEQEIVDFEQTEKGDLEAFACVFYENEDYPTHGGLVEMLSSGAGGSTETEKEEYKTISNALAIWTKDGSYGAILDGYSNVNMSADIIHFELGEIPDTSELKSMVGFILTNRVRSEVTSRSRAEKKVFVYEEAAIILGIEGGAKLFLESLAQMGKYSCQVTIVTQQLAQFMNHKDVAEVALGNCRQFLILRNSLSDLKNLAQQIGMPEQLAYQASLFKPPSDLDPGNRYASAVLFNGGSGIAAMLRIYAPKEVLWVSDSEGNKYAERMAQLRGVPDNQLLDKIIECSHA